MILYSILFLIDQMLHQVILFKKLKVTYLDKKNKITKTNY